MVMIYDLKMYILHVEISNIRCQNALNQCLLILYDVSIILENCIHNVITKYTLCSFEEIRLLMANC